MAAEAGQVVMDTAAQVRLVAAVQVVATVVGLVKVRVDMVEARVGMAEAVVGQVLELGVADNHSQV